MCLDTVIKNTYKKIKVLEIFGVLRKSVTKKIFTKKICYLKLFMCLDTIIKNTYKKIKVSEIFGVLRKSVTRKILTRKLRYKKFLES